MKQRRKNKIALRLLAFALTFSLLPGLAAAAAEKQPLGLLIEDVSYSSMAALGDTLYMLDGDGLYTLSAQTGERALVSPDIHARWLPTGELDNVDRLRSDGERLYALNSQTKELFEVKLDAEPAALALLAVVDEMGPEDFRSRIFIADGRLVWMEREGIAAYALDTGDISRVPARDLRLISPWKDGRWAALTEEYGAEGTAYRLISIDPATGETSFLADAPAGRYYAGLHYRGRDQLLVLNDASSMLGLREGEKIEELGFYPRGDIAGFTLVGDMAAVMVDNMLVIRSLDPDARAEFKQLNLLSEAGRGEEYMDFLKTRPDVSLNFRAPVNESPEEAFVRDMLTRSDEVDIYLLEDMNLLDIIRRKGYAYDMAQSPEVKAAVTGMHRPFREALVSGEKIIAFPHRIYLDMFSYNKAAFEELGLTAPESYGEYFDFCIDWIQNRAEDEADYGLEPFSNGMNMVSLLRNYGNELSKAGKPLVFSNDTIKNILQKYMAVYALGYTKDRDAQNLFYLYMVPRTVDGFAYLPLRFDSDHAFIKAVGPGEFAYFVINPYTKNPEDALSFIESYQHGMEPMFRLVLEEKAEPMINPNYESEHRAMLERLALLSESAAQAEDAERRELEARAVSVQEDIAFYEEEGKWAVTREEIDSYLAMADSVFLPPFNPIPMLAEEYPNLFDEWRTNPNFNIDQFLSRLDDMVQKVLAERD